MNKKHNIDTFRETAQQYKTRSELRRDHKYACSMAVAGGYFEECVGHMPAPEQKAKSPLKEQAGAKFNRLVEADGGQLLTPYTMRRGKVIIECKCGSEWQTTWVRYQKGHRCPVCSKD